MWAPQANRTRFQHHGLTNFETASGPHARIVPDSNARHQSPPIEVHAPFWDVGIKANRKRFELPILAYGITRTNRTDSSARARIAKIPVQDLSGLWSPWLIVPDSRSWLVA